ncbi:MAG: DoxX family protein [Phaeodactylibacter sp.]|nr:DoxX family protein [Phaeodactylibacter sp.]MCB9287188.1 DoxX family protein [Lewinellaceae bacterium]
MQYSKNQLFFLASLRILIGWHFLYEGLIKIFNPGWTSKAYLLTAEGPFSSFFTWLGGSGLADMADVVTIILLIGVGLALVLGAFEKVAAFAGIALLAMFYLSHPPLPWLDNAGPSEGNYFIVNKNLIELAALGVVAFFPTSHLVGLMYYFKKQDSGSEKVGQHAAG